MTSPRRIHARAAGRRAGLDHAAKIGADPRPGKPVPRPARRWLPALVLIAVFAPACASVRHTFRSLRDPEWAMAQQVVIHRDRWGVPHIEGRTDAAAVFGLAWAQAEDNFWQLEEDFIWALGRGAQVYGESEVAFDLVRAAFEVERLSREEYAREPAERRALWAAYAAGLNYWVRLHPDQPRLLRRFEPWFVFALFRGVSDGTVVDGVRLRDVIATPIGADEPVDSSRAGPLPAVPADPRAGLMAGDGSNAWAIAPERTRDGHALLFLNPHVSFFGGGQRWEVHLASATGWAVAGFAILGTPLVRSGHNEAVAWTHTNTGADAQDAWLLHFDHETDPLAYRWGDDWRRATEIETDVLIRTDSGMVRRRYRFLRTHLGPVVGSADGRRFVVRIARFEEGGSLQQWYAMSRAQSLDAFRAALAQTAFPISNTVYADREGNIMYVHGNAVPRRDTRFDWTQPVDGADPATEWQGYHDLDELPQLVNPPAGWIQNTNATPFLATGEGSNLDPAAYPSYMAREGDNARARTSREILAQQSAWTVQALEAAAFDTRVPGVQARIDQLIDAWERQGATASERMAALDPLVDRLRTWDGVSSTESTAMTAYMLWQEELQNGSDGEAVEGGIAPPLLALERAATRLREAWDTLLVPWGEVNRLQRQHTSGTTPFDDRQPSLPIAGAPPSTGMIFAFSTRPGPDGRRRYGVRGHTWVGIVELAPQVRARTIVPFGQSADPDSPHWFDQAPLYARGAFKDAWFTPHDVAAHTERSYHPGDVELQEPARGR